MQDEDVTKKIRHLSVILTRNEKFLNVRELPISKNERLMKNKKVFA